MRRAAFRIFPRQTLSARARPPHTGAPHPQPAAMRRRISFGESVAICRGLLYTGWCCGAAGRARGAKAHTERYRSGHNGGASKALWEQSHVGSNPTLSAKAEGPCSAWALCFAFGQVGFEGRNRRGSGGASPRPGENGQETAPRGAQAGRRPCGESHPLAGTGGEGPCSAWALCFAFGQVGFEGRNRKCRSAAFSRPGENGQETAPRGAQAGRRPCGESHPLRHVKTSLLIKKWRGENPCLQGFSPFLCSFSGSGSAFDALLVYSFTPCLYTEYLDLHPMHPRR